MIRLLYTALLIVIFPFFLVWFAWQIVILKKYRNGVFERFGFISKGQSKAINPQAPVLWVHAASMGEVLVAEVLIRKLQSKQEISVYITTNTDTGCATAKQKIDNLAGVFQAPFDFPWIIRRFLNRMNPDCLLLIETEIWPNMLYECKTQNIGIMLANGRISDRSYPRYKKFASVFRTFLNDIDVYEMQSQEDANRICSIGALPGRVTVSGNVKFDRNFLHPPGSELQKLIKMSQWEKDDFVIIAGSTHDQDEDVIISVFSELKKHSNIPIRMIIAPRHLERVTAVVGKLQDAGIAFQRRSEFSPSNHHNPITTEVSVILLDVMGELSGAYSLGKVGFVGGTFQAIGGHNLLEPAAHSIPVVFGPNIANCRDIATLLIRSKGGACFPTWQEMYRYLLPLIQDNELRGEIGAKAHRVVEQNRGAVDRHIERLIQLIEARRYVPFRKPIMLTRPLTRIFSGISKLRMFGYDSGLLKIKTVEVPVISIGNIGVGGTGKTPMVVWILTRLLEHGIRPVVVSRGYGGTAGKTPVQVPEQADYRIYGDEPVMISRMFPGVPIIISHDRVNGAEWGIRKHTCHCIVLDDGFQHRKIQRQYDLVLIDTRRPFSLDRSLPMGRLRENPSGLKRANAIMFTHCETEQPYPGDLRFIESETEIENIFHAQHVAKNLRKCHVSETCHFDDIPQPVALISAIGSPDGFRWSVKSLGFHIGFEKHFSDHADVSEKKWIETAEKARQNGCRSMVTTSKDETRVSQDIDSPLPIFVLDITIEVSEADVLEKQILALVKKP